MGLKKLGIETSRGVFAIEDAGGRAGRSLVLLHGAIANLRAWDSVIPALGDTFRVVSVDLPAHGWTSVDTLMFPGLAAGLVEICARLGLDDPILVGHSFGGLAAVVAAGTYPTRFSGVLTIDPYLSDLDVQGAHETVEQALSAVRREVWPWDTVSDIEADIDRAVDTLYSPGRDPVILKSVLRRGYREQPVGRFLRYPRKEDNMEMIKASWALGVNAAFDAVSCPLAIAIATGSDAPRRRGNLAMLRNRRPAIEAVEFPCGHDIVGFMPIELAEFITAWARRIQS